MTLLIDEVEMYLRAWKSAASLVAHPEYKGVSGQVYTLDFNFDGSAVIAIPISENCYPRTAPSGATYQPRANILSPGISAAFAIDDRRKK